MLSAIKTIKKTGKEPFLLNNEELPFDVLSFWQWSSSELLGNALRGVLAEFIIASALGITKKPREEWDAYDLITSAGLKIEVKSSSYLQSWEQTKLSKIIFGIQPTEDILVNNGEKIRRSDIYIFCVLSHQDKNTVNPLNLSQWDFYILDTDILNERVKKQKTITLSSLLKLNPVKVKYDELENKINR
jgi:hypothetical protein